MREFCITRTYGRIPRKKKKQLRNSASSFLFCIKYNRRSLILNAKHAYFEFLFQRKLSFYYNFGSSYQDKLIEWFG